MAKALKNSPNSLSQAPSSGEYVDADRILETESAIIDSRNNLGKGLRSVELNEKLERLRMVVLENIDAIFSDMGISDHGLVTHIGITKEELRTSWSEIDGLIAHLILKWSAINSGSPEDPNELRAMMDGEFETAEAEVASKLDFGDYEEMRACIEMGKENEKRSDLN